MSYLTILGALRARGGRFLEDRRGASAIEFSLLALPFIGLMMFTLQIGLYDVTKMSLDAGVIKESESLQATFNSNATLLLPSAATVKTNVANYSGSITNNSNLAVEIQPLANLDGSSVAITDGLTNYGASKTVLAIRASVVSTSFMPGLSNTLTVYSSALVRRQNQ